MWWSRRGVEVSEEIKLPNNDGSAPARSEEWLKDSLKLASEKIAEVEGIAEPSGIGDTEFREMIKRLRVVAISMGEATNSNVGNEDANKEIRAAATKAFEELRKNATTSRKSLSALRHHSSNAKVEAKPMKLNQNRPREGQTKREFQMKLKSRCDQQRRLS